MRTRIQRSATLLLAVFTTGALLLPFGHEFTHVQNLEHRHGRAAADLTQIAVGPGGIDAVDFLVEERTLPHNPNCDLCARLVLDTPTAVEPVVPFVYVDGRAVPGDAFISSGALSSRQIRAPPVAS